MPDAPSMRNVQSGNTSNRPLRHILFGVIEPRPSRIDCGSSGGGIWPSNTMRPVITAAVPSWIERSDIGAPVTDTTEVPIKSSAGALAPIMPGRIACASSSYSPTGKYILNAPSRSEVPEPPGSANVPDIRRALMNPVATGTPLGSITVPLTMPVVLSAATISISEMVCERSTTIGCA